MAKKEFKVKPPSCFEARTAVITLREKKKGTIPERYTVVCPAEWSKSQFLAYVRAVHPNDWVKLLKWNDAFDKSGNAVLWLTNHRAFSNYKIGVMKT